MAAGAGRRVDLARFASVCTGTMFLSAAGIDLALWMVEKLSSREIADLVRRNLEWTHEAVVASGQVSQKRP